MHVIPPPFLGCTASVAVCELPIEVASPLGGHKPQGLGLQWVQHTASAVTECGSRVPGLQYLWRRSLVALQHVESLQTRERTHVPCIGRWTPIHCVTRKIPNVPFTNDKF